MTQLKCPQCDADLRGKAVEFVGGQARCRSCGEAYRGGRGRRKRARTKEELALPPSIEVKTLPEPDGSATLSIRVPWRVQHAQAVSTMVAIGVVATVGAVGAQLELSNLVIFAAMTVVTAVIIGLRYVNVTIITVTGGEIRVRHAPIPWFGRKLEAASIEQLYVTRRPLAQHHFDYNVIALLKDEDDQLVFLRSLADPAVALYLEQCIEDHLEIVDRRVTGEFGSVEQLQQPTGGIHPPPS